jgi:hypothetical protein
MAQKKQSAEIRYGAFTSKVFALLEHEFPTRDTFSKYCQAHGLSDCTKHLISDWWPNLLTGKSLPLQMANAMVSHIRDRNMKTKKTILFDYDKAVVEMAAPLSVIVERKLTDWLRIKDGVNRLYKRDYTLAEGMRASEDECITIATKIMCCVGQMTATTADPKCDPDSCLVRAIMIMGRKVEDYAATLAKLRAVQPVSVMFGTVPGKIPVSQRRVSACVTYGVTGEFFARLRDGQATELDLAPSNLQSPSSFAFLSACGIDHKLRAELGETTSYVADMHALFYQTAHITRKCEPLEPAIVTMGSNRQYYDRLINLGYRPTGSTYPGTPIPMMVLDGKGQHGGDTDNGTCLRYQDYVSLLRVYRLANSKLWDAEDGLAGKDSTNAG